MNGTRIDALATATALLFALGSICCGQAPLNGMCEPGYFECDFFCADLNTDPQNCGACGLACAPGEVCNLGRCKSQQEEVNNHAGSFGSSHSDTEQVSDLPDQFAPGNPGGYERCNSAGQEGLTSCGGTCVNTLTDRSHCGGCFNACPAGMFCRAGACTSSCSAGLTNCGGICVNLQIIRRHCGACNHACAQGDVCSGGECMLSCQLGLMNCQGSCVNLQTDREHCSACGNVCAEGEACSAGSCSLSCQEGLSNCGGMCVDVLTDRDHCSACNHACTYGRICIHGTCELPG